MLLLTDTWSAACCWLSACTSCSIVRPLSARRCSIQVSGSASAGALALQAARELGDEGAAQRRLGARHVGDDAGSGSSARFSATSIIRSAQLRGQVAVARPAATRAATRRRFSISASRSMIGIAHSSPSLQRLHAW